MEKIETFKKQIKVMEECLNNNKPCFDEMDLYRIKKQMLEFKLENPKNIEIDTLLQLMNNLDTAFDKDQAEKMNHKLNLLTVWSTIFLPLSFYTGMWGMNFDDVPLLNGDNGFWIFSGLTVITVVVMFYYFKKKQMVLT